MTTEQLDFITGGWTTPAAAARDEALDRVEENAAPWCEQARDLLTRYPYSAEATGEDLRLFVESRIGPPHHHNAAGAMIAGAVRKKILEPTGEYRPMKSPKSHARKTPVYRIHRGPEQS